MAATRSAAASIAHGSRCHPAGEVLARDETHLGVELIRSGKIRRPLRSRGGYPGPIPRYGTTT